MPAPTEADGADTPPALQPRKLYRNRHTNRYGYACRLCPDHEAVSVGGFESTDAAHQAWLRDHVPANHPEYTGG